MRHAIYGYDDFELGDYIVGQIWLWTDFSDLYKYTSSMSTKDMLPYYEALLWDVGLYWDH